MVFSSMIFLWVFLPIVLVLYFLSNNKVKNMILLLSSLIFYAWGEPVYVILMILSSFVGYIAGLLIEKKKTKKSKITVMVIALLFNFGALGFFKYGDFLINNINSILNLNIPLLEVGLPIGISLFTFQIVSYYIDVYRGGVVADHNFITFFNTFCAEQKCQQCTNNHNNMEWNNRILGSRECFKPYSGIQCH